MKDLTDGQITFMLFLGIFISAMMMLGTAVFLKEDGQTFQVISTTLVGGFAGAFFTRIQNQKVPKDGDK